jgi:hypothetical protein
MTRGYSAVREQYFYHVGKSIQVTHQLRGFMSHVVLSRCVNSLESVRRRDFINAWRD